MVRIFGVGLGLALLGRVGAGRCRSGRAARPRLRSLALPGLVGVGALLVAACTDGGIVEPEEERIGVATVDATTSWAFVALGEPVRTVSVADRSTSTAWDIGFFATSVMLNGGAAGPAGVEGHCICQNAGASNAEVGAMTPATELAKFRAVTAAQIPAAAGAWQADSLAPVITGWYRYDAATRVVSAVPERSWLMRLADGTSFAKFRVVGVEGATRGHAGRVTFEYAVQSARGAPLGELRRRTVDLSGGRIRFDLRAGVPVGEAAWDIAFEGYTIRVNGGVSGAGRAGAVLTTTPFEQIRDASALPDRLYRGDAFGGVFVSHPWFRYNITGTDRQVWPTYDVYLVRRGGTVYKIQLIGYYNAAGEARHVTFRYARLRG
jgi:hypothetical protein